MYSSSLLLKTDFFYMVLELQPNCQDADYLRVRNGQSVTSPLIGTFCGTTVPNPITSSENHLYIRFHSDSTGHGTGTMMSWTSQHAGS